MIMDDITKNIGLFFYRGYYQDYYGAKGLKNSANDYQLDMSNKKNKLFKKYSDISDNKYINISGKIKKNTSVSLTTTYPGLYTGSGYTFGAGVQGEFQMGFLFDHTTGLPYFPGSSIKGAVRAAFPNNEGGKLIKNTKHRKQRIKFLWGEIIEKIINKDCKLYNEISNKESDLEQIISKIELELFEGRDFFIEEAERKRLIKEGKKEDVKEQYLSIYKRDIFHDVFISKTVRKGATSEHFLGIDYITPHPKPLKNPIPLTFLKILPEVEISFQFSFNDGYYLTAEEKSLLVVEIIKSFGIGAKTNIGYGQLY